MISLSDVPELDNRRVKTSTEDVLVDRVVPGEMLVIAFGIVSWQTRPDFDFFGRLKKLEQNSGRHLNKVLVRDSGNAWYHRKNDGLGGHPDERQALLYHEHRLAAIDIAEEGMDVSPDWLGWAAENLRPGGDPRQLVAILQQHGFSDDSSAAAVARGGGRMSTA